jgi:hypothetical protein
MTRGCVVRREATEACLERSLETLGLNAEEATLFLQYWRPRLRNFPLSWILSLIGEYAAAHPWKIEPQPDTVIRVYMAHGPMAEQAQVHVRERELKSTPRRGFSVVEWGGGKARL